MVENIARHAARPVHFVRCGNVCNLAVRSRGVELVKTYGFVINARRVILYANTENKRSEYCYQ
jgi:hypothetical protein